MFGKSGVGKTTLMRNMIIADLRAGNGLTVVDPHGALIEDSRRPVGANRFHFFLEADRRPHSLYADEVQNFTHGVNFPTILSEARKYALSLTIGTQTLSQLPGETIAAVFGNCGSIISFRVSGDDANALVREFGASGEGPRLATNMYEVIVPASELQNLPDYKLYLRTLIDGKPQEPFLVESFPPFSKLGKETTSERVVPVESLAAVAPAIR